MLVERLAVAAVWAATLVCAVLALALAPVSDVFTRLALTLALSVVAGIVAQVAVGRQDGFVLRLAISAVGSSLIVAAGAAVAVAAAIVRTAA